MNDGNEINGGRGAAVLERETAEPLVTRKEDSPEVVEKVTDSLGEVATKEEENTGDYMQKLLVTTGSLPNSESTTEANSLLGNNGLQTTRSREDALNNVGPVLRTEDRVEPYPTMDERKAQQENKPKSDEANTPLTEQQATSQTIVPEASASSLPVDAQTAQAERPLAVNSIGEASFWNKAYNEAFATSNDKSTATHEANKRLEENRQTDVQVEAQPLDSDALGRINNVQALDLIPENQRDNAYYDRYIQLDPAGAVSRAYMNEQFDAALKRKGIDVKQNASSILPPDNPSAADVMGGRDITPAERALDQLQQQNKKEIRDAEKAAGKLQKEADRSQQNADRYAEAARQAQKAADVTEKQAKEKAEEAKWANEKVNLMTGERKLTAEQANQEIVKMKQEEEQKKQAKGQESEEQERKNKEDDEVAEKMKPKVEELKQKNPEAAEFLDRVSAREFLNTLNLLSNLGDDEKGLDALLKMLGMEGKKKPGFLAALKELLKVLAEVAGAVSGAHQAAVTGEATKKRS